MASVSRALLLEVAAKCKELLERNKNLFSRNPRVELEQGRSWDQGLTWATLENLKEAAEQLVAAESAGESQEIRLAVEAAIEYLACYRYMLTLGREVVYIGEIIERETKRPAAAQFLADFDGKTEILLRRATNAAKTAS